MKQARKKLLWTFELSSKKKNQVSTEKNSFFRQTVIKKYVICWVQLSLLLWHCWCVTDNRRTRVGGKKKWRTARKKKLKVYFRRKNTITFCVEASLSALCLNFLPVNSRVLVYTSLLYYKKVKNTFVEVTLTSERHKLKWRRWVNVLISDTS